jgi:hypothetical protein
VRNAKADVVDGDCLGELLRGVIEDHGGLQRGCLHGSTLFGSETCRWVPFADLPPGGANGRNPVSVAACNDRIGPVDDRLARVSR